MQKINNNNISFKSNIHFVNKQTLEKIRKGANIDHLSELKNIRKNDDFYTSDIRTCTAGSFVFKDKDYKPVGFHFYNSKFNFLNSKSLVFRVYNQLDKVPDNGLLIGSKELMSDFRYPNRPFSIPLFKDLKKAFSEVVENISIFELHKKLRSQTHYYYSKKDDTHYICAESSVTSDGIHKPVKTLDELVGFYKNISIAKTDTLFINGKEINRKKAPDIFAKSKVGLFQ